MIWVTWRQHRMEALGGGFVLALTALFLFMTHLDIVSTYQHMGLAACAEQHATCSAGRVAFEYYYNNGIGKFIQWLDVLPLLAGMFVGAPLVAREVEHGTHHLVWTQSITRLRWLAVKLGLLISAMLLAFLVLDALMTWWSGPVDSALGPWATYDWHGVVLLAYALFAYALGVAVGMLVRRSVPAMALTIIGFLLLRLAVAFLLRPSLLPPLSYSWDPLQPDPRASLGDWDLSSYAEVDRSGHQVSGALLQACDTRGVGGTKEGMAQCLHDHGILYSTSYHPADQFWLFQGIETAIFLALTVALVALTIWWVRKRIA